MHTTGLGKTRTLTQKFIATLKYSQENNKKDIWWDKNLQGFGLRIYPSGRKAYIIQFRINGRKRLKTLGSTEILTLSQAKQRAKRDLVGLLDNIDPLENLHTQKSLRFTALCSEYMQRYSKPFKKSWNTDQSRVNLYLIPKLGQREASSIMHSDIAALHIEMGKDKKPTANRVVKLISSIYSKAISWDMLPKDYQNPAKGITFYPEYSRDRWLSPEELPKLIQAIEEEDRYARAAIWLSLLTGLRKYELLALEWSRIDLERLQFTIYETKNNTPLYLPISPEALAVIEKIPKLDGNNYLFPSKKQAGGHLKDFKRQWLRVRKKAGVMDIRWHDLRRTLGSWLAQSGNSLHLIAKVLNHKDIRTTQVYARFAQDDIRTALNANSKKMFDIAKHKIDSNI